VFVHDEPSLAWCFCGIVLDGVQAMAWRHFHTGGDTLINQLWGGMASNGQFLRAIIRPIRVRPRLFIAGLFGVAVAMLVPNAWAARNVTRLILGWNGGAWLYLALSGWMMVHADQSQIHRRARLQDEGARTILTLVVIASLASLGAIVAELSVAKDLKGLDRVAHVALAVLTLLASWGFAQMMFALHYAHDYYAAVSRGKPGGLMFPDTERPDYLDFLYFAAVIGTSGQTADVAFANGAMRRVGLVHCVLAFVFNTSMVGLMINVASSLL
jgi:uncharacterized membrane protein